jgi:response regulator of citrate/malate metabolism
MIDVLVVDDDFRVARIHQAFVDATEGFRTIGVVHTAAETRAAVRTLSPDLILLDLYLPDVFGLDLINQLRVEGVEGDVIVISAANESQTVERAVKLGVNNYLLKPFTRTDLTDRLQEYRTHHQARQRQTLDDQARIDQRFGRAEPSRDVLPKGMSPETAALVLAALHDQDQECSAQTLAEVVGISRVSARRYLEHFAQQGLAQVTLRYGSPGRPERLYRLSREA